MKKNEKPYIIRKSLMASSIAEAIRNEKKGEMTDVFVDPEWLKAHPVGEEEKCKVVGFREKTKK